MSNDLSYKGRKRPAGASQLTQNIYILLSQNPQGLTRDEIHDKLKDNWGDTDTYRMYQYHLVSVRKRRKVRPPSESTGEVMSIDRGRYSTEFGSPLFRERAQKWAIGECLRKMKRDRTSHQDKNHWFTGERVPRIYKEGKLVDLNVEQTVIKATSFMQEHLHRETLKEDALFLRSVTKFSQVTITKLNEIGDRYFDYLSGRL